MYYICVVQKMNSSAVFYHLKLAVIANLLYVHYYSIGTMLFFTV